MTNNGLSQGKKQPSIKPISWDEFEEICRALALGVDQYDPDAIVGVARGGLYPAAMIAHLLQKRVVPLSASKIVNDGTHQDPELLARPNISLAGQKILVVDEICVTGKTLLLATKELLDMGAIEVKRAVMCSHTEHQDIPEYIGIITDDFIINPWDRYLLQDGQLEPSTEYTEELKRRNLNLSDYLPTQRDQRIKLAKPSRS